MSGTSQTATTVQQTVAGTSTAAGVLGAGAPNNDEGAAEVDLSLLGALPNNENGSLSGAGEDDAGKAPKSEGGVAGVEVDFVKDDAKKLGTAEDAFPTML